MKRLLVLIIPIIVVLLSACSSGISQEEHQSLQEEHQSLIAEYNKKSDELAQLSDEKEEVEKELKNSKEEVESVHTELEDTDKEFESYREKMAEYENLADAEAEARRIEAESIAESEAARKESEAESEKARKESEAAEAAAKREAEEKKGYETGITYDQLARNPDDYLLQKVKFKGKVLQVMEGTTSNQIRLAVNNNYDQVLYCEYNKSIVSSRILEDDRITIYGYSVGLFSYESTGAGTITIPAVMIDKIDQ